MDKWLRRIRNSLGYGVQSPSDFYFVRHVLREESPYYAYSALEDMCMGYGDVLPNYSGATNKLLFRLANYVHHDTIIEVGAGLSIFAMAMACPFARSIAITSSASYVSNANPLLHDYLRVEVKNGDEKEEFCSLIARQGSVGLLHVAHTPHYRSVVEAALSHIDDDTLMIIEGLRDSKEKKDWWQSLQENRLVGISYDLGSIGLLFFNRSRHKDTYWINLKE